jgi:hypothetical protein
MRFFRTGQRKFKNIPTEIDGIRFDSKKEAQRYVDLKMLERIKEITALELQPKFTLAVNGHKICDYRADFRYCDASGAVVVEDVKSAGTKTRQYRIKIKLLRALTGIEVREV